MIRWTVYKRYNLKGYKDSKTCYENSFKYARGLYMDIFYKVNKSSPKKIEERKQSWQYKDIIDRRERV